MSILGKNIQQLRKSIGLTQSELAKKIGVSGSAVGMYEQGRREPDNDIMIRLCTFFGVSSDFLLGREAAAQREVSDIFDEFTRTLSNQKCLMMNGMPINDEERSRIVDAINVVKAIISGQHGKTVEG